jgi:hypothetical protein
MYSSKLVGTPDPNPMLSIANGTVSYANGYLTVTFTRPYNSGKSPLDPKQEAPIIWAVGPAYVPLSSCSSSPPYHGFNRGMRFAYFPNPELTLPESHKCSVV